MILDIHMVHDLGVRLTSPDLKLIECWMITVQSPDDGAEFDELWSLYLPEGAEHEQDLALRELIAERYGRD